MASKENNVELSQNEERSFVDQFKKEYETAEIHIAPKRQAMYDNFKLYNNSKRDVTKVGDPTLFTVMQTILAYVQEDRLQISFGSSQNAKNRDLVALSDYDEMDKQLLDYYWNWNTFFFGRACVLTMEYDRESLLLKPELLDPLTLLRDPAGSCVNGDTYGRPVGYIGRPVRLTKYQLENSDLYKSAFKSSNLDNWQQISENSSITQASRVRDEAANRQSIEFDTIDGEGIGDNKEYEAFQMFTHFGGKKVLGTFAQVKDSQNNKNWEIVNYLPLKTKYFPIVDRVCYPSPHDWDGVSIPSLVGDKQRLQAVLINLGLEAVVRTLYPKFVYNKNKISGVALSDPQQMGFAVDGEPGNVISELSIGNPNMQMFDYMKGSLRDMSERSTATSDIQQGISGRTKTATESEILATRGNVRYSLLAKIFSISDREFWRHWYSKHKLYMTDNDIKQISTTGEIGSGIREFKKSDFVSEEEDKLRVVVQSKSILDANRLKALGNFMPFYSTMMQRPNANTSYLDRKLGRLIGFDDDELKMIMMPDQQEHLATVENGILNKGELPKISKTDDHKVHIFVHSMANDNSATKAHIEAHYEGLANERRSVMEGVEREKEIALTQTAMGASGVSRASSNVPLQEDQELATKEVIQSI